MAEREVDADIEIDSGAMFRNIMDAPRGQQPEPQGEQAPAPQGEPRLPAQHQPEQRQPQREAPQLTEHQRQQIQPEGDRPTGERARDPATGRFAPRDGEQLPGGQQPQAGAAGDADRGAQGAGGEEAPVPSWRLREEREARAAYATQLKEAQDTNRQLLAALERLGQPQRPAPQAAPQRELPDPVLDPRGYHAAVMEEVTSAIRVQSLDSDLRFTHARHGEKFEKAYEAFLAVAPQHPDFARSVVNGPAPGQRMVDWYERQTMMQEIGPNPQAWMERQLAEALKNPEILQRAIDAATAQAAGAGQGGPVAVPRRGGGGGGQPEVTFRLPPTLSRLPSGSPDSGDAPVGENNSDHMFRQAMSRQRK